MGQTVVVTLPRMFMIVWSRWEPQVSCYASCVNRLLQGTQRKCFRLMTRFIQNVEGQQLKMWTWLLSPEMLPHLLITPNMNCSFRSCCICSCNQLSWLREKCQADLTHPPPLFFQKQLNFAKTLWGNASLSISWSTIKMQWLKAWRSIFKSRTAWPINLCWSKAGLALFSQCTRSVFWCTLYLTCYYLYVLTPPILPGSDYHHHSLPTSLHLLTNPPHLDPLMHGAQHKVLQELGIRGGNGQVACQLGALLHTVLPSKNAAWLADSLQQFVFFVQDSSSAVPRVSTDPLPAPSSPLPLTPFTIYLSFTLSALAQGPDLKHQLFICRCR